MGVDFTAVLKYDGPTEAVRAAIERLRTEELPAELVEWVGERVVPGWEERNRIWSAGQPVPPPALPNVRAHFHSRGEFRLTFGPDFVVIHHVLRMNTFLSDRFRQGGMLDAIALFARIFEASDCLICGDTSLPDLDEESTFATILAALDRNPDGELPDLEDLQQSYYWGQGGCWRFAEAVPPAPLPRAWPPRPRRELTWPAVPAEVPLCPAEEIDGLTFELLYETWKKQRKAAGQLGELGPAARAAVPALVEALGKKRPEVRAAAAHALERIGDPGARPALQRLAVEDPEAEVRHAAWFAWAELAPVPGLAFVELLAREDWNFRGRVFHRLADLGPQARAALSALLDRLARRPPERVSESRDPTSDPGIHPFEAAKTAWRIGADARHLRQLVPLLRDREEWVRFWIARTFVTIGEEAGIAAPALIDAGLIEPSPPVRGAIAWALGSIGLETSIPLVEALAHPDPLHRANAADLLGRMRVPGVAAELTAMLHDPAATVRRSAAQALLRLNEGGLELVAFLAAELRDPHDDVRYDTAIGLAALGERAATALPALIEASRSGSDAVRQACGWARRRIERFVKRAEQPG